MDDYREYYEEILKKTNDIMKTISLEKKSTDMVNFMKGQITKVRKDDVTFDEYIKRQLVGIEYMVDIPLSIINAVFVIVAAFVIIDYTTYDDDNINILHIFGDFYPNLIDLAIVTNLVLLCNNCFSHFKIHFRDLYSSLSGKYSNDFVELYDKCMRRLLSLLKVFDLKEKTKKVQEIATELEELTNNSEELKQHIDVADEELQNLEHSIFEYSAEKINMGTKLPPGKLYADLFKNVRDELIKLQKEKERMEHNVIKLLKESELLEKDKNVLFHQIDELDDDKMDVEEDEVQQKYDEVSNNQKLILIQIKKEIVATDQTLINVNNLMNFVEKGTLQKPKELLWEIKEHYKNNKIQTKNDKKEFEDRFLSVKEELKKIKKEEEEMEKVEENNKQVLINIQNNKQNFDSTLKELRMVFEKNVIQKENDKKKLENLLLHVSKELEKVKREEEKVINGIQEMAVREQHVLEDKKKLEFTLDELHSIFETKVDETKAMEIEDQLSRVREELTKVKQEEEKMEKMAANNKIVLMNIQNNKDNFDSMLNELRMVSEQNEIQKENDKKELENYVLHVREESKKDTREEEKVINEIQKIAASKEQMREHKKKLEFILDELRVGFEKNEIQEENDKMELEDQISHVMEKEQREKKLIEGEILAIKILTKKMEKALLKSIQIAENAKTRELKKKIIKKTNELKQIDQIDKELCMVVDNIKEQVLKKKRKYTKKEKPKSEEPKSAEPKSENTKTRSTSICAKRTLLDCKRRTQCKVTVQSVKRKSFCRVKKNQSRRTKSK